jgi:hypothetical protein
METLFVLAFFLLLIAAAAPGIYALRKRMTATGVGPLELWRVLHRRGLGEEDTARDPRGLGYAVRRCMLCPSVETCHEWLEGGKRDGLEEFCPNASYVQKLERR